MLWPIGEFLLSGNGDGIKNYYTPTWYIENDGGTHFSGMNYPYGDNVVYSDNQPLLSWVLQWVHTHIIPIGPYTPWVLHIMIMLGFSLCAMLLYQILSRWISSIWLAATAALLITFLSPQTERLYAHFALAYTLFVPLIWYQLIRLDDTKYTWRKILSLAISLSIFTFLHLYYLLIGAMFILSLMLIRLIKSEVNWQNAGKVFAAVIFPFVIFFLYTALSDSVVDRPSTPYGFFEYRASFQSIFIPTDGLLNTWWFEDFRFTRASLEGYGWVGYTGWSVLIISLFILFRRIKKSNRQAPRIIPENFRSYFVSSLLVLAFSMALPFSLGLDSLLDIIPFIKQFRSPGRFVWVFYFVFMVYGVILLQRLSNQVKPTLRLITLVLFLVLLTYDTKEYVIRTRDNLTAALSKNVFNHPPADLLTSLPPKSQLQEEYQAILYLPFFHNGSEKLYIDRTFGSFGQALQYSYHLGLPLINCMMSRTSISQSLAISALVGHSLIPKDLPDEMDDRPILLIVKDGYLLPTDLYWSKKGKAISSADGHTFFELPISMFQDTQKELLNDFKIKKDSLYTYRKEGYYAEEPLYFFYRNDFEDEKGSPYLGNGAKFCENGREYLIDVPVDIDSEVWAEVSCWTYTFYDQNAYPSFRVELIGPNGEELWELGLSAKESTDIDGNWVRASISFPTSPEVKSIRLTLIANSRALIDELVVRDTRYNIFYDVSSDNETLIFNNFPIGK